MNRTFSAASLVLATALMWTAPSSAGEAPAPAEGAFHPGPVLAEFGAIADVDSDLQIPADTELLVAFDAYAIDAQGTARVLDMVARLVNMHAAAGVAPQDIHPAIVLHGPALLSPTTNGSPPSAMASPTPTPCLWRHCRRTVSTSSCAGRARRLSGSRRRTCCPA